jgi:hypothetical protein
MVTYLLIFVTLSISAAYGLSNDKPEPTESEE